MQQSIVESVAFKSLEFEDFEVESPCEGRLTSCIFVEGWCSKMDLRFTKVYMNELTV